MKRKQKTYTIAFRRKRKGKTDYKKRLKLLLVKKPRIAVRKSLKNILIQIIEYDSKGDKILVSTHTNELKKLGWKANKTNLPAGYLCGYLLGKKAKEKNISECIFDIGMYPSIKGSLFYSVLKGLIDAGMNIPHSIEIFPKKERIQGKHIADWAKRLKNEADDKFKKTFSAYIKEGLDPEKIDIHFNEIKKKIEGTK